MNADILSLLNLLVVVLIVAAVIVVVMWVARVIDSPRGSGAEVFQPRRGGKASVSCRRHGSLTPGWYPDQNDPNLSRYFDERMWTTATRPPG
jgi:hypothetical protein